MERVEVVRDMSWPHHTGAHQLPAVGLSPARETPGSSPAPARWTPTAGDGHTQNRQPKQLLVRGNKMCLHILRRKLTGLFGQASVG